MKTRILAIALCIGWIFSSCQKEDLGVPSQAETKATFNVAVDNGNATRATVTDLTRYIMEVYEVETASAAVKGAPTQRFEEATGTFNVILKDGVNYACLFFADYGTKGGSSNEYNATDLKSINIVGQATKASFGGAVRFTYDSKATTKPYLTPTLTHSVAQVNYKQTENFTAADNTLTVEFPKTFSLNLDGNVATEIGTGTTATHTFSGISKVSENATIGTSYIIVADATQTVMDIKTTFNKEIIKDIANVPFQRNYRTNISGAYSNLYEATLSVSCDDVWETPDNNTEIVPPVIKYAVGDLYPDATNPIGVVFMISNGGTNGKILALSEEADKVWSTENVITSAYNKANGLENMRTIKALDNTYAAYPAFAAAHALNTPTSNYADGSIGVWYLPAKEELDAIYKWWVSNTTGNNLIITDAGGSPLSGNIYWSSTECTSTGSPVWYVNLSNGDIILSDKSNSYYVRCIRAF